MLRRRTARTGRPLRLAPLGSLGIRVALRALSGLDAGFLYLETPEQPMHVGSLTIYDPPADLVGPFANRVREHLARRLHLAPLLHQRLEQMPLELGHPVWVEAGEVDLDWHVRSERLERPGSLAQLEARVAELHAQTLDRTRPLWQFTVFDGLAGGRVAMFARVHHAALDGAAGVQLAHAMMDLGPVPRDVAPAHARRARDPGKRKLLGELFSNSVAQYAKLAKSMPDALRAVAGSARDVAARLRHPLALREELLAPKTRFNAQIGSRRAFATLSLPLEQAKAVGAACGATLNDVLLACVSGALVRYLKRHRDLPRRSLVAAVPFNLRGADASGGDGNQVTMLPTSLATDLREPGTRLAAIHAGMNRLKAATAGYRQIIPTDFPSLGAPWLFGGLTRLFERTRLADRIPLPANLVVSNVPGPPVPLYLAGARMRGYYPVSIVVHGLALNLTVHSYDGQLDIGIVACPDNVPDLPQLVDDLRAAFDELRETAANALTPQRPAAKRPAAKRPATKRAAGKRAAVKAPAAKRTAAKQAPAKRSAAKPAARRKTAPVAPARKAAAKRAARRSAD
jgi:diacylglycerol O-acyltransferase